MQKTIKTFKKIQDKFIKTLDSYSTKKEFIVYINSDLGKQRTLTRFIKNVEFMQKAIFYMRFELLNIIQMTLSNILDTKRFYRTYHLINNYLDEKLIEEKMAILYQNFFRITILLSENLDKCMDIDFKNKKMVFKGSIEEILKNNSRFFSLIKLYCDEFSVFINITKYYNEEIAINFVRAIVGKYLNFFNEKINPAIELFNENNQFAEIYGPFFEFYISKFVEIECFMRVINNFEGRIFINKKNFERYNGFQAY